MKGQLHFLRSGDAQGGAQGGVHVGEKDFGEYACGQYADDAQGVAIEDKRFWEHSGVDWIGTASAIKSTVTGGATRGGSTIIFWRRAFCSPRSGERPSGLPR